MSDGDLKVLIADDEPLAAERLQLLLAKCEGIDLVGTATDGESTVRMAEALGREVPASRYSPSMDLHPMFRADLAAKDAAFLHSWSA